MVVIGCANGDVVLMNSPLPAPIEAPEDKRIEKEDKDVKDRSDSKKRSQILSFKGWVEKRMFDNFSNIITTAPTCHCKAAMDKYAKPAYMGYFVERYVNVHTADVIVIQV
jgi:hypothetical protein